MNTRSVSFGALVLGVLAWLTPALFAQNAQQLVQSAIVAYQHKAYDRAIAELDAAIRNNPKLAVAYLHRAHCYKATGQYDKAIADYTTTIQLAPNDATPYCCRAYVYHLKADRQRALADYAEAIRLNPKYQVAYYDRSLVEKQEGNYRAAIADATHAVELNPKDADAFGQRGTCYMFFREFDRAIADFSRALRLKPNDRVSFSTRAGAYCYSGRWQEGLADLSNAIRRNRDDHTAYNELAWLMSTFSQPAVRNGKEAVQYATKACQLTKWHEPHYVDTLAAACAEDGDFADAIKWETKYIEYPELSRHWVSIGRQRLALYQAHKPLRADN